MKTISLIREVEAMLRGIRARYFWGFVVCLPFLILEKGEAQEKQGTKPGASVADVGDESPVSTLSNALRFLDGGTMEDLAWSEAELQKIAKSHPESANIHYAIALAQYAQGLFAKSNETLQSLGSKASIAPEVRTQSGLLQLYVATVLDDKPRAERLFQALSEATLRESIPLADRKRYATALGELVGLLEPEVAKSPIDSKWISKTKGDISRCGNSQIEQAFKYAYGVTSSRAAQLAGLAKEVEVSGVEGLEKMLRTAEAMLAEKMESASAQKESIEDARDSNNEATKQLRLERKRAETDIRAITAEMKTPTPGHPGPPIQVPPRPNINLVQVEEFEAIIVVDSKGKQQTILQRRPQFEIDRERNFQFQILNAEYNRIAELSRNRQNELARWEKADRERRRDLLDKKGRLQEIAQGLATEIERLSDASKSVALEFRGVRDEEKQIRMDIEVMSDLLAAAKENKMESAFRPLRLRVDDIAYQKNRLVKILVH